MRILFCTDGSKISFDAILNFSKWATDPVIDILNVFDLRYLPDFISLESHNWNSLYENSSDKILDYTEVFLKDNNLNVGNKLKKCGSIVDEISDILSEYDFVVLGSNGKKGIQKWLGSVSQEVAAISQIPVFISKTKNCGNKILFTVDNGEASMCAVKDSVSKLNLQNKEIYLANIYEIPDYMFLEGNLDFKWIDEVGKKQERDSEYLLQNAENFFINSGLKVKDKFITKGIPAQEIISLSSKYSIDMVVTGSEKKKSLSKVVFGSVSLRILSSSKSDVLILKY